MNKRYDAELENITDHTILPIQRMAYKHGSWFWIGDTAAILCNNFSIDKIALTAYAFSLSEDTGVKARELKMPPDPNKVYFEFEPNTIVNGSVQLVSLDILRTVAGV